jgi:hypothetical protein
MFKADFPKRPNILDEYDWQKVKSQMDKDEDGDIWWNIRGHIADVEGIYDSSENLFRVIMQKISNQEQFKSSIINDDLEKWRPQILNEKKEWEAVRNEFNASVWFELLQYNRMIETLYENMYRILIILMPELYEFPELPKT